MPDTHPANFLRRPMPTGGALERRLSPVEDPVSDLAQRLVQAASAAIWNVAGGFDAWDDEARAAIAAMPADATRLVPRTPVTDEDIHVAMTTRSVSTAQIDLMVTEGRFVRVEDACMAAAQLLAKAGRLVPHTPTPSELQVAPRLGVGDQPVPHTQTDEALRGRTARAIYDHLYTDDASRDAGWNIAEDVAFAFELADVALAQTDEACDATGYTLTDYSRRIAEIRDALGADGRDNPVHFIEQWRAEIERLTRENERLDQYWKNGRAEVARVTDAIRAQARNYDEAVQQGIRNAHAYEQARRELEEARQAGVQLPAGWRATVHAQVWPTSAALTVIDLLESWSARPSAAEPLQATWPDDWRDQLAAEGQIRAIDMITEWGHPPAAETYPSTATPTPPVSHNAEITDTAATQTHQTQDGDLAERNELANAIAEATGLRGIVWADVSDVADEFVLADSLLAVNWVEAIDRRALAARLEAAQDPVTEPSLHTTENRGGAVTYVAHYWRHRRKYADEFDTLDEAKHFLESGEEHDELSAEKITDSNRNLIWDREAPSDTEEGQ